MSETDFEVKIDNGDQVSEDDLRRMLDDYKGQVEALKKERDGEANRRAMTEQERDAERAARLTTETERDGANTRVASEAMQRFETETTLVKNGIEAQKSIAESAEEEMARQAEAGDWKAHAAAQRKLSAAEARLVQLDSKREYLEVNKDKLIAPPPAPARREVSVDPIARLVNGQLEPTEHEWLRSRPEFLNSQSYRNKVFGASQIAASEHKRGTDGYFREMERILGESSEAKETPRPEARERAPSADIAPQRRASPGANTQGNREVKLTAEQAEVADSLYGNPQIEGSYLPDPKDRYIRYWKNLETRRAQGRM